MREEFISSKGASNQTSAGWNIGVEKAGVISVLCGIDGRRTDSVPLSDAGVVEVLTTFVLRTSILSSRSSGFALRARCHFGRLGVGVEFNWYKEVGSWMVTRNVHREPTPNERPRSLQ